jgi:hypothetical protein
MNLQNLTNEVLEKNLIELVAKERNLLCVIILHVMEIERRKVYLNTHPSLFEYLKQILKYSHGTTQRRISAAMLALEIPEILPAIQLGQLNLTQINTAQMAFKLSKKLKKANVPKELKLQILNEIIDKTCEESEVLIYAALEIKPKTRSKITRQADGSVYFQGGFSKSQWATLQRAKELLSHSVPSGEEIELIVYMAERVVAHKEKTVVRVKRSSAVQSERPTGFSKADKSQSKTPSGISQAHAESQMPEGSQIPSGISKQLKPSQAESEVTSINQTRFSDVQMPDGISKASAYPQPPPRPKIPNGISNPVPHSQCFVQNYRIKPVRRSILPAATRRAVFQRGKCCEHRDPVSGKQCESKWQLQIDHIQPVWAGGDDSLENLQVLCALHNRARYQQQSGIRSAFQTQ